MENLSQTFCVLKRFILLCMLNLVPTLVVLLLYIYRHQADEQPGGLRQEHGNDNTGRRTHQTPYL